MGCSAFISTLVRCDTGRSACMPPNAETSGAINAKARQMRIDEDMLVSRSTPLLQNLSFFNPAAPFSPEKKNYIQEFQLTSQYCSSVY